jgi:hypothetical protein
MSLLIFDLLVDCTICGELSVVGLFTELGRLFSSEGHSDGAWSACSWEEMRYKTDQNVVYKMSILRYKVAKAPSVSAPPPAGTGSASWVAACSLPPPPSQMFSSCCVPQPAQISSSSPPSAPERAGGSGTTITPCNIQWLHESVAFVGRCWPPSSP